VIRNLSRQVAKTQSLRNLNEDKFLYKFSGLGVLAPLMKIRLRSQLQFLQSDLIAEFLQPVNAAFCYSLAVALIKVVSTQIGISLFAG
jgi:hypothetical protein